MYGKYYISHFFFGVLAIAAALEDQPIYNKNITDAPSSVHDLEIWPIFTRIGQKYYFIETEETKNWYDAFATCHQMGARLVAFNTVQEWMAMVFYLRNNNLHKKSYWTSGNDLAKAGNHVWFPTGDPIPSAIWGAGEPNNRGGNEHCENLWADLALKLNDGVCTYLTQYICELLKQGN